MGASYGKLMMWFFLLSDAFTFSGLLITYGLVRASHPAFEGLPELVRRTARVRVTTAGHEPCQDEESPGSIGQGWRQVGRAATRPVEGMV